MILFSSLFAQHPVYQTQSNAFDFKLFTLKFSLKVKVEITELGFELQNQNHCLSRESLNFNPRKKVFETIFETICLLLANIFAPIDTVNLTAIDVEDVELQRLKEPLQ